MLAMPTPRTLDWARTTTPGGGSSRRGRMMVDRFSGPTMFTRGRGKCETRQRRLEFRIAIAIAVAVAVVGLVGW